MVERAENAELIWTQAFKTQYRQRPNGNKHSRGQHAAPRGMGKKSPEMQG